MNLKITFIFLLSIKNIEANPLENINTSQCKIPNAIMLSILKNESSNKRKVGYPFLIRINGKQNIKKTKSLLIYEIKSDKIKNINSCVYDCKNKTECIKTVKKLLDSNIVNLDLGPYQTNYKFHKYNLKYYFSLSTSFLIACKFQHELINRYGYSWETIARYHSGTPKLNRRYKNLLVKEYKKIIRGEQQ